MKNTETEYDDLTLPGFDDEATSQDLPESFEDATGAEISEVLAAFKKRAKEEELQKAKNISTDFWFAVYFASEDQRNRFLQMVGLFEQMERDGADFQYIDGQALSEKLGLDIGKEKITIPKAFRRPADIDDLVMEL